MKQHVEFDLDFKRNTHTGRYIVLEGINASGKTTQIQRLKDHFEKQEKTVVITSEPNDGLVIGKLIREIIHGKLDIPSAALQYLYTADRIVNHEKIVIPALQKGHVVLSSRSFWSAIVYGILDEGADYTRPTADLLLCAQGVLSMYHQIMLADYNFYLDVSLDTILQRLDAMGKPKDIYEDTEKLKQLIAGYEWVVKQFDPEFIRIDAEKSIENVTESILANIKHSM